MDGNLAVVVFGVVVVFGIVVVALVALGRRVKGRLDNAGMVLSTPAHGSPQRYVTGRRAGTAKN